MAEPFLDHQERRVLAALSGRGREVLRTIAVLPRRVIESQQAILIPLEQECPSRRRFGA